MSRSGIHRISVPTPFLVGNVNCYLIKDEPLTLVDTGPNVGTSLDALELGLAQHGVRVEDLELIVLTHQHTDHVGLIEVLARRSGAQVAAWAPLAPWLASYASSVAENDEYARVLMAANGLPEDLNTAFAVTGFATRGYGSGAEVTVPLVDGQILKFTDRRLEVLFRPGHSPSDIVLWDPERELLLGGDLLMASVASNAILTRPLPAAPGADPALQLAPGHVPERTHPLLDYRESLRAALELPVGTVVLPGHGPDVTAHRDLIPERMRVHERRARKILRTLSAEPMSAHQIAVALWGRMAITQAPLMMSEVLGHLDLLLQDGSVTETAQGGVTLFVRS